MITAKEAREMTYSNLEKDLSVVEKDITKEASMGHTHVEYIDGIWHESQRYTVRMIAVFRRLAELGYTVSYPGSNSERTRISW